MSVRRSDDKPGVARARGARLAIGLLAAAAGCEVVGELGATDLMPTTQGEGAPTSSSTGAGGTEAAREESSSDAQREPGAEASSTGTSFDTATTESSSTDLPPSSDGGSSSDETAGALGAACCVPSVEPGCSDPELEACVCEVDEYCCSTHWDEACVGIASYGACAGACIAPELPPPGDCCVANDGGGCLDLAVQDCVCAFDPYCCDYGWDAVCVEHVVELDCSVCG